MHNMLRIPCCEKIAFVGMKRRRRAMCYFHGEDCYALGCLPAVVHLAVMRIGHWDSVDFILKMERRSVLCITFAPSWFESPRLQSALLVLLFLDSIGAVINKTTAERAIVDSRIQINTAR